MELWQSLVRVVIAGRVIIKITAVTVELDAKVDAYWRRHEPDARAAITAYKQATGE